MSLQNFWRFFSIIFWLWFFQLVEIHALVNNVTVRCSGKSGVFKGLTDYQATIQPLLSKLLSQTSSVSFYPSTSGVKPNRVFGLYYCRPDLSLQVCTECIRQASLQITAKCPARGEAIVWYDECMLRYAKRAILSLPEVTPEYKQQSKTMFSDYSRFVAVLGNVADSLIHEAALSTPYGHFATKEANLTSHKLYFLALCTPDIKKAQCESCLRDALGEMARCCDVRTYTAVFKPSCQLRYDTKLFYNKTLISPPLGEFRSGKGLSRKYIVAITTSAAFVAVFLVFVVWFSLHRRTVRKRSQDKLIVALNTTNDASDTNEDIQSIDTLQFDIKTIKVVTQNFSKDTKLGKGGFGEVYKGKLANGQEIAVKRLSKNSTQGTLEFKNEVLLVAKLQHRNLVRLLGFCTSEQEKILIYEFLTNSSLDRFLFEKEKRAMLDWKARFQIITGIAKGLLYLHEDSRVKIIHRDLKCSNILLDEAMNPKISDFGLARHCDVDQTQFGTKRIAGTYGYMAPEYAMAGQFSVKSDVYSFGVIMLEMISGQRNSSFHRNPDEEALLHRAWRLWSEEAVLELVDPLLGTNYSIEDVKMCIHIGLLCIQEDPSDRPKMALVVAVLNGQSIALPSPNVPQFSSITGAMADTDLGNYDLQVGDGILESKLDQCNMAYTGPTSITDFGPR